MSKSMETLDAQELDSQLLELLKYQLKNVLKFYKFSLKKIDSTIGQGLLSLKYFNTNQLKCSSDHSSSTYIIASPTAESKSDVSSLTSSQKHGLLILNTFFPWFKDKFAPTMFQNGQRSEICKLVKSLDAILKVSTLLNFLIFLKKGQFVSLSERVLHIRSMFTYAQTTRQISYELTEREILWNGFTLLFTKQYSKSRQRNNKITGDIHQAVNRATTTTTKDGDKNIDEETYKSCPICNEWPFNPQQIGCGHVFCYYCIHSQYKDDSGLCCPLCFQTVDHVNNIQPVPVTVI
ncbi:hypothetical protein HELRODRAFT_165589 [Helobdella robusta]|uniref:Peroxisome biogenesis factor 2 n=1 Tax=Helobdella robusta TaxID=6412 RepID=T1EX15_HELRO|nr:hypothetical protein HELRODRAFT_165589 [Helobdella robusta]ESN91536.1 hypothetical protein HELRODRAFT_165589 [Helobdella robusta]